ncbi:MAG: ABC transporter ATP-binding protein [Burkholderiaceae bacterium]
MAALITCRKLGRTFDIGGQPFVALRDVDLEIDQGELVAVIGASGSGKSTLLNLIGGLDQATTGSLDIDNRPIRELSEPDLAHLRNVLIGFVFQQFNLLPRYSALRNVEMPMIYAAMDRVQRHARARELLAFLGLEQQVDKRPTQMSGGQQQRVAIARALANKPRLILADEPTGALDSKTSAEVMRLLIDLNANNNTTVVIVTHDPTIAAQCRRQIRFSDGVIIEDTGAGKSP